MKRLIAAAAVAVFFATGAQAADIAARTYAKAPPMAPVFSWTGWYVGLNAGAAWGSSDAAANFDPATFISPPFNAAATAKLKSSGFTGGGQIGYNYQFAPSWLLGVEADLNYTDLNASRSALVAGGANRVDQSTKSDWLATIRGRLGFTVDKVLFYGTGGVAFADVNVNEAVLFGTSFASYNSTRAGWTGGGGIEWAFAPSWSLKAEYLYVDLGSVNTGAFAGGGIAANPATVISHKIIENIARAGVNYHF